MLIEGHEIRQNGRPFIIAEVGQAHDGSLGLAHSFIDIAADAGVDAIKFQTHIAAEESTEDEPFRVPFSYEDKTRFDYWRRMEFTFEQWEGLATHARDRELVFLSSCFSRKAVDWMRRLGMPAWKVGSGELFSSDLIAEMLKGGEAILLSTGLASAKDISGAVGTIREAGAPLALFQCTTSYPAPLASVGLNVIDELASDHGVPVGLSDHSGSPWPGIAAMARGAALIEVHMSLHPKQFGPDTPASLAPDELAMLVDARNAISEMLANPVDKALISTSQAELRGTFGKSLALVSDLPEGTVLTKDHLTLKKPGGGLAIDQMDAVVGKRLKRDVSARRLLRADDIEPAG